eukprot:8093376-Pyramimonas_sp.AAC.1
MREDGWKERTRGMEEDGTRERLGGGGLGAEKHVAEPDGQIWWIDPTRRVGKEGPGCQVEQAGC